jgi:hypothetical protein
MNPRRLAPLTAGVLAALWGSCPAQESPTPATPAPAAAPTAGASGWHPDDRLILSGDGATLSGTNGGGGGSVTYLHEPSPDTLIGAAVEYQHLYTADWAFGSLSGSYSHALTATTRWNVHGEIHEGEGRNAGESFNYGIEAIGAGASIPGGFALDLEERQIDVATDHGSLPKAALSWAAGPRWLATVAYAHSFGGNLNTEYTLARVDYAGGFLNLLGGGSTGHVNPVVISIDGLLEGQSRHLNEAFFGVTKPFHRFDLTLLADEIDLAGSKHFVGTLSGTLHLN